MYLPDTQASTPAVSLNFIPPIFIASLFHLLLILIILILLSYLPLLPNINHIFAIFRLPPMCIVEFNSVILIRIT